MTRGIYFPLLAACLALACRSLPVDQARNVDQARSVKIRIVDDSGQAVPGVTLYAVYPVSASPEATATAANGIGVVAFPPGAQRQALLTLEKANTVVGEVAIKFDPERASFFGEAQVGYYTELDINGKVLHKRRLAPQAKVQ